MARNFMPKSSALMPYIVANRDAAVAGVFTVDGEGGSVDLTGKYVQITDYNQRVGSLETKVTTNTGDITNIKTSISAINSSIGTINTSLSNKAAKGVNSDITALTALSGPLRLGSDGAAGLDAATVNQLNTVRDSTVKLSGSSMTGSLVVGSATDSLQLNPGNLEIFASTPFIDFHFNNTVADYDVRIINSASNQLTFSGSSSAASFIMLGSLTTSNVYSTKPITGAQATGLGSFMDYAGSRTRFLNQPGTSSGGFDLIALNSSGTAKCTWNFNVDGGIAGPLGAVTWQASDKNLKNTISDVDGGVEAALNRLMKIKPREFSWNNNGKKDRGFIAQEMLAIDERYANYSYKNYDPENDSNDLSGEKEGLFGLSDRAIMADVVAVVQKQQKTINDYEAVIAKLQDRLKALDGLEE